MKVEMNPPTTYTCHAAVPDFHTAEHASLPHWHPEIAACATCTPDEAL